MLSRPSRRTTLRVLRVVLVAAAGTGLTALAGTDHRPPVVPAPPVMQEQLPDRSAVVAQPGGTIYLPGRGTTDAKVVGPDGAVNVEDPAGRPVEGKPATPAAHPSGIP
jgi:hypothetical protein